MQKRREEELIVHQNCIFCMLCPLFITHEKKGQQSSYVVVFWKIGSSVSSEAQRYGRSEKKSLCSLSWDFKGSLVSNFHKIVQKRISNQTVYCITLPNVQLLNISCYSSERKFQPLGIKAGKYQCKSQCQKTSLRLIGPLQVQ